MFADAAAKLLDAARKIIANEPERDTIENIERDSVKHKMGDDQA